MNFDLAFDKLIGHEGGYTNNPADPGGETKWGISKRSYPSLDIASLSMDDAKVIYRRDFWDPAQIELMPDEIRFDVFDGAVNSGISQSIKWLQMAVQVDADGQVGTKTQTAWGQIPGNLIHARYNGYRLQFMSSLVTWKDFGRGWANRVAKNLIGA